MMRQENLIVGAGYVLYGVNDRPESANMRCVYLGRHDGVLELADGSTYNGAPGALRFRVTDAETDTDRTLLLESGSTVIETTQTRTQRQQREADHAARVATARAHARAFLTDLGISEVYTPGDRPAGAGHGDDTVVSLLGASEDADELIVHGLTIAELRAIVGRTHVPTRKDDQLSTAISWSGTESDQRRYLELRQVECRECDWRSGRPHEDHELVYTAWRDHFAATGHRRSWDYRITRSAAITDPIARIGNRTNDRKT